ncbi:hypothetical protein R3P38DRAFT_3346514 [Favolaschia claudopus]|uniref:SHSP domain-containing protein n=1 Tax=Favolaschia claudopus TaxID=2862362 RepID=A0AAW0D7G1_9AGAR
MSYSYGGQQGAQYPDEYVSHSAPPTPRESSYQPQQQQQWEPQESQHSHSQLSDNLSQQTLEQALDQPQDIQPLSIPPPSASLYDPHPTLEDPQHLVPSQLPMRGTHDLTPIRLVPVAATPQRSPPVEVLPVLLQVDTTVRSTAHAAGPSHTRPASRARPHQYHPYPRPSSASGSSAAAQRREIEAHHHVRFASQTNTPLGSAQHSPAAGRQSFVSLMSEYPQATGHVTTPPSFVSPSPQTALPEGAFTVPHVAPPGPGPPPAEGKRFLIRSDTHYDKETRVLTALLELPGLAKDDLSVTLTTTLFNRIRQVTVTGQSRSPFPASPSTSTPAPVIRERRYGRFARAFPVPADTKPEDIDASLEGGVLVLRISCGLPAASADEHEIPIR